MREKYLPIGTVVLLKGGKKRAMITGFCSTSQEDQSKIYDYSGCVYPEGYLSSDQVCLFDHSQIEKIFFVGYEDEEEKSFKDKLEIIVENLNRQNNYDYATNEPDYEDYTNYDADSDNNYTDYDADVRDDASEENDLEENGNSYNQYSYVNNGTNNLDEKITPFAE